MKKYRLSLRFLYLLPGICFLFSCNNDTSQKRFEIPVETILKLDSTEVGITTILDSLNVPWEIAWGPDDQIWFTQQGGTVSRVDPHTGTTKRLLDITPQIHLHRTMGLLGMALYAVKDQQFVVLNYTTYTADSLLVSRLERYTYAKDTLIDPLVLLEIPGGAGGHNGSRVIISAGKIFWATGDAGRSANSQDISSLNGKILRLNLDGSVPDDNPYRGSLVWSLGHRNIQGLVAIREGKLFSAEHGEATDDEVNLISKGTNYGWPRVQGFCDKPEERLFCDSVPVREPLKAWTPCIAPSGLDYYHSNKIPEWHNSLLLLTLKGVSLRALTLNAGKTNVLGEKIYFDHHFGRLRDICISPTGDIYIATSNRDWNPLGVPAENDDRIIRVAKISDLDNLARVQAQKAKGSESAVVASSEEGAVGEKLYVDYCASCHKQDGKGVEGIFPALQNNTYLSGDKTQLTKILLQGSIALPPDRKDNSAGSEKMPAFNFLTDQQVADLLSYMRQKWGAHPQERSEAEEVYKIRNK